MITLNDYIAIHGVDSFINDDFSENGYSPINTADFQKKLCAYMQNSFGSLEIRETVTEDSIAGRAVNVYYINDYRYKHLWNTTQLEYNPIENYNMTESGTDTTSGSNTQTSNIGSQTTTNSSEATSTIGAQDNSNTTTTTYSGDKTTEHNVSPYDSETYYNQSKDTESFSNRNDKTLSTSKLGAREDSDNRTDTINSGARSDSTNGSHSETVTHELSRSGNIGVLTTQQMLESERQLAEFNFIHIVAKDILKNICICVYR